MGTYKDIRTRFEMALNEATKIKYNYKRHFFDDAYNNWMRSTSYPGDTTKPGTGEQLRADLGIEPTDNVTQMLILAGLPKTSFDIKVLSPGEDKAISRSFPTIQITILTNINVGSEVFERGEKYFIISNVAKTKSGKKAVVGRGKLTPKALELDTGTYSTVDELEYHAINNLKKIYGNIFPKNYIDYLEDLVSYTKSQNSVKRVSGNLTKFLKQGGQEFFIDFDKNLEEAYNIDAISLAKIANDFGEILGGIFLFSVVTDPGKGVSFPKGANAALVDFYFDGWDISSKAGKKGGTPSIVSMCNIIHDRVTNKDNNKTFELKGAETKTYHDIIKVIADPKSTGGYVKEPDHRGRQSNVWLTNIVLANHHLYNIDSGYRYILNQLGISNMEVSRKKLHTGLDNLFLQNPDEWYKVMQTFWEKAGSSPSGVKNKKQAIKYYEKRIKKKDPYRFGIVFYPVSKELVNLLNSNKMYTEGLSSMINRVSSVQQLYLLINVKDRGLKFKLKDFTATKFQFQAGTGANEPFNKNIGLESR